MSTMDVDGYCEPIQETLMASWESEEIVYFSKIQVPVRLELDLLKSCPNIYSLSQHPHEVEDKYYLSFMEQEGEQWESL